MFGYKHTYAQSPNLSADPKLAKLTGVIHQMQSQASQTQDKEAVLVIGATGAGKSTFINYMAGRKLEADTTQADDAIICKDPLVAIGHGLTSCTDKPQIYNDKNMPFALCDCPGFFDNRGVDVEVANAIGIQSLAKNSKNVKGIILMVDRSTILGARGQGLEDTIKQTLQFLGPNMAQHLDSIFLLITKVPANKVDQTMKLISDEAHRLPLCAQLLKMGRIGFYNALDEYKKNQLGVVDRQGILDMVSHMKGVPSSDNTFNIAISAQAELELTGVVNMLSGKIKNQLIKNDFDKIPEYMTLIDTINSLKIKSILTEVEKLEGIVQDQIKLFEHHQDGKKILESLKNTMPQTFQPLIDATLKNVNERIEKEKQIEEEKKKSKEDMDKLNKAQENLKKQLADSKISQQEFEKQNQQLQTQMTQTQSAYRQAENKIQSLHDDLMSAKKDGERREASFKQELEESNRNAEQRISRLQSDLEKTRESSQRQERGGNFVLCQDPFGRVFLVPNF